MKVVKVMCALALVAIVSAAQLSAEEKKQLEALLTKTIDSDGQHQPAWVALTLTLPCVIMRTCFGSSQGIGSSQSHGMVHVGVLTCAVPCDHVCTRRRNQPAQSQQA